MKPVDHPPKVGFIQWHDLVGGAEIFTNALVLELRRLGIDASIILIGQAGPSIRALTAGSIPVKVLGHPRSRSVVRRFNAFRAAVTRFGPDAVVLPDLGFLAPMLRLRGYTGKIFAIAQAIVA